MNQPVNQKRRKLLILSGVAGGALMIAPILTKINFVEETIRTKTGIGAGVGEGAYGQFPYGGIQA